MLPVLHDTSSPKHHFTRRRFPSRYFLLTFAKQEARHALGRKTSAFPLIFQLQTIDSCNGACIMCPNAQLPGRKPSSMPDQLFEKIIDEITAEPQESLILFFLQNEPLLDPTLARKIKRAKTQGDDVYAGFITNGTLLSEKTVEDLEDAGLDYLLVSIDGATKTTYEKIRPRFQYETVTTNLEHVLQSDLRLILRFTLQRENQAELNAFKSYWHNRGVSVQINIVGNRGGNLSSYDDVFVPPAFFRLKKTIGRTLFKLVKCCPQVLSTFNILSNGDVILCCNDFDRSLILGNVNKSSIKDIWNSEKYQEIRRLFHQGRINEIPVCRSCSEWETGVSTFTL